MDRTRSRSTRAMEKGLESLRRDAADAFAAAVAAVQPAVLLPAAVRRRGDVVLLHGEPLPEVAGRRVVAAVGKAAPGLAAAWGRALPGWADEVLVLAPHGVGAPAELAPVLVLRGAHPEPDEDGERSARRLLALADGLGSDDLLVVLLSGGASALLAAPSGDLGLEDLGTTTRLLLQAGAPIAELNTLRRELLEAAGGGLADHAQPAAVVTLVLSDVLGNLLSDVASGPTVPSPTTPADALSVLDARGLRGSVPPGVVTFLEARCGAGSSDDHPPDPRARTVVLADNRTAIAAAASLLFNRGYITTVAREPVEGDAAARGREVAARAGEEPRPFPTAWVAGGETTVTVHGCGRGGRCQELALAAAVELDGGELPVAILAAGTDGIDGRSENAGAIVDPQTAARIRSAGVDPAAALAANDSASAVEASGDALVTGPTGTNVCDLVIVLESGAEDASLRQPRTNRKPR